MGVSPATVYKEIISSNQSFALTLIKTGYEDYEETLLVAAEGNNYVFNVTNVQLTPYSTYIPQTPGPVYTCDTDHAQPSGITYNQINNQVYVVALKWATNAWKGVVMYFDQQLNYKGEFLTGDSGTPWGITCDTVGNVYVSHGGPVKIFTSSGTPIDTIGNGCRGIKIQNNRMYSCETKITVYDITTKSKLFDFGYDGNMSTGEGAFENPSWLEVTGDKIFVIDESQYVRCFDLNGVHQYSKKINFQLGGICSQDANYLLYLDHQYLAKLYGQNGKGVSYADTGNDFQKDICTDGQGNYYVSDPGNNMLRKYR